MAEFIYNNQVIEKSLSVEKLMLKHLHSEHDGNSKIISDIDFINALKVANYTKSIDVAIIMLKKYNFNIKNEKLFEEVKQYLISCLEKSILLFDKKITESRIVDMSYYRASQSYNGVSINEKSINSNDLYDNFDYLVNYLTNAILSAELIYTAENQAINYLKQKNENISNETAIIIDDYIMNNLNLSSILGAYSSEKATELLKKYNKTEKKK